MLPGYTAEYSLKGSTDTNNYRIVTHSNSSNTSNSFHNHAISNRIISPAGILQRCPRCSLVCEDRDEQGRCWRMCCDENKQTYYMECQCPSETCVESCGKCGELGPGLMICTRTDCTTEVRPCTPPGGGSLEQLCRDLNLAGQCACIMVSGGECRVQCFDSNCSPSFTGSLCGFGGEACIIP